MGNAITSLSDRYTVKTGRVLLSGIQALVRLPMEQMRRDHARELNTGTFISGYRGSPLGGYDKELVRNKNLLEEYNIRFQPGVNEELAATAVWGSQQVNLFEGATVDGVCGIWYGKTPGVDRSTDAFRHGNAAGSSPYGGVLVVAGDDHGCKSSSYPGQSEFAFVDMHMPILNPSNIQEVLDYGLYGFELSRFSGCWVAMITLTENMDSAATVEVDPDRVQVSHPADVEIPEGGLNIRLPDTPLAQEERLWRYKRPAALAFCRENRLNRVVLDTPIARLGIVTAGKAHLDLMQALDEMNIDEARAQQLGVRILKVGMTYPLDVEGIREFARGLEFLFVVEEKRSLMEVQLKEELYNVEVVDPHFPKIIGKLDSKNNPLLPAFGELTPGIIIDVLKRALPEWRGEPGDGTHAVVPRDSLKDGPQNNIRSVRTPFFCSGCPHNTSTRVPDGSRALAGIGCHYLVQGMQRETQTFTQMGGEGASWIGQSHFTDTPHVFVNLGDGTYFHSGVLAIRAAVAAGVNITYKILFNGAVAMTGGQPHDGDLQPEMIVAQVQAEGVERVVWVMDDPGKYRGERSLPRDVEVRHRDDLDAVQRELREVKGVTCILYDQACATELRRKRKRGLVEDPARRLLINDLVCEGCGDCSVQSNCMSVEPKQTMFGTKRKINQTTCNKDFSCVKGFCPSFVEVEGGELKKPTAMSVDFVSLGEALPAPELPALDRPWSILVTGVGGTGVVTVGALLAMAAFIEGKAVTTLDQTGLAQKGGAVYSHIRIAKRSEQLHAVRISEGSADALLACDLVGAAVQETCLSKLNRGKTQVVANRNTMPTAAFTMGEDSLQEEDHILELMRSCASGVVAVDGFDITEQALGTTTTVNILMLGFAYQQGLVPLHVATLYQAMELNGVAVENNKKAFNIGRLAMSDPGGLQHLLSENNVQVPALDDSLGATIEHRAQFLADYQDTAYAERYRELVGRTRDREEAVRPGSEALTMAVARNAAKLMAYKDEYEVARLYTSGEFEEQLRQTFSGDYKLKFNLAPPLLTRHDETSGVTKKVKFGGWIFYVFKMLARLKVLRGTRLDLFSYTDERRRERQLIDQYFTSIGQVLENLSTGNLHLATQIATLPDEIRGYGHVKSRAIEDVSNKWQSMLSHYLEGHSSYTETSIVRILDPAIAESQGV